MNERPTLLDRPSPHAQSRPPGTVIAAIVLMSLLSLGLLALAVTAIAAGSFHPAGLLLVIGVAAVLALVAIALWQGRPGSRGAAIIIGLLLFGYGVYLSGRGASASLETLVGLVIAVLLLNRKARAWTADD